MSSRRSPTTPKGVPSETYLKRLLGEGAERLAVLVGGALEEASVCWAAGLELDEALPDICRGLPQVGEAEALVRGAPDAAGGVVDSEA